MPDKNLNDLAYAPWLENALKELINFPVRGLCFTAIGHGGEVYTNYHDLTMVDKITIAGVIQQDAMLDTLIANDFIEIEEDEE